MYSDLDFVKNRNYYQMKLNNLKVSLAKAKDANATRQKIQDKYEMLSGLYSRVSELYNDLVFISAATDTEYTRYKKKQIGGLETAVDESLAEIFPELQYTSSLSCNLTRNQDTISLSLIDKNGNIRYPGKSEGKLLQYLVSFSATLYTLHGFGCNTIFIDEAFAASSMRNLPKIGTILNRAVQSGMQLILIAQNNLLYEDLPRHEIKIASEMNEGDIDPHVKVVECNDI